MTKQDCLQMFALLAAAYPKEPMTKPQIALYTDLLAPFDAAEVREAVLLHIQKSPWFPRPSDLLSALTKREELDADEAWAEVKAQIRRTGYYGTPEFSHTAIAEAVRALGWQDLCLSENQEADRAHFMRFYERAVERQQDIRLRANAQALNPMVREMLGQIGQLPDTMRRSS